MLITMDAATGLRRRGGHGWPGTRAFAAGRCEGTMTLFDSTIPYTRRALVTAVSWALAGLLIGARSDPEFMRYDAEGRRVDLTVIAAFDQSNSGFNFNGGSYGGHRITVPAGWLVRVTFINRDVIPHSVAVVREQAQVPMYIRRPAFAGAVSRDLQRGLPAGGRQDSIVFVAGEAGTYLFACGVPGHAVLGSYLRLDVSSDVTVPTYEMSVVSAR
jgi:sulfocyanin